MLHQKWIFKLNFVKGYFDIIGAAWCTCTWGACMYVCKDRHYCTKSNSYGDGRWNTHEHVTKFSISDNNIWISENIQFSLQYQERDTITEKNDKWTYVVGSQPQNNHPIQIIIFLYKKNTKSFKGKPFLFSKNSILLWECPLLICLYNL